MSSLQMVARIKKTEDEKTLNQEFDKSRFDNSWTDPKYGAPGRVFMGGRELGADRVGPTTGRL